MSERQEINFKFNLYENKKTIHKALKFIAYFLLFLIFGCVLITFILTEYSSRASKEAITFYFEKSPDIIAVFTGDRGRLEYAFEILKLHPESKLLISGVYNKNTIQSLLNSKNIKIPEYINEAKASQVVELDYQAQNTIENVLMTLQYIRKDQSFKNILIISSDYHLLRINLLVNALKINQSTDHIHYFGVRSEHNVLKRIKDASLEAIKIIRSLLVSLFWMSEEAELHL